MEERLAWGATLEDILKELDIDPAEVFEDQKREIASFFIWRSARLRTSIPSTRRFTIVKC